MCSILPLKLYIFYVSFLFLSIYLIWTLTSGDVRVHLQPVKCRATSYSHTHVLQAAKCGWRKRQPRKWFTACRRATFNRFLPRRPLEKTTFPSESTHSKAFKNIWKLWISWLRRTRVDTWNDKLIKQAAGRLERRHVPIKAEEQWWEIWSFVGIESEERDDSELVLRMRRAKRAPRP